MQISPTELYFLLKLDSFRVFTLVIGIILIVVGAIAILLVQLDSKEIKKRWQILPPILGAMFILGYVLTPSTKEMLAVIIVPKIVNSEFVQHDIPEEAKEVYGALKKWLIEQATSEMDVPGILDDKAVSHMEGYQLKQIMKQAVREELEKDRDERWKNQIKNMNSPK